ncbi:flagellar motor protein [Clostridium aminobutyricum]|uniref:Flagellar motor protein n=1 Tax=Clostridium aminobutyricum TaxID=33953 RepID=A0A939IK15_CLOAM|nr:flagellar motor protein [Clostridium aminobutyricum]MBN7774134.1 flagellar motor protein [Clostridium aminobutyricum]
MDIFVLIFLVVGFGAVIGGFLLEGGHLIALVSLTSIVIILGGTIGATGASFPKEQLIRLPKIFKVILRDEKYDTAALIQKMKAMCIQVRQNGLLSLENQIDAEPDSLMRKGMRLIVDGTSAEHTKEALEVYMEAMADRHHSAAQMFEAAGGFSPTMGITGTVLGLVHVLGNLEEPDSLGPKIATAFIATLYGIGIANLIWLPLAGNLKAKHAQEVLYKSMIIEGLLLIQQGANTNYMDEKLTSFLSEAQISQKGSGYSGGGRKKRG